MSRTIQSGRAILTRFLACEEAATATEYALVLCVLAVVAITAALSMGEGLSHAVSRVSTDVSDASALSGNGASDASMLLSGPQGSGPLSGNR